MANASFEYVVSAVTQKKYIVQGFLSEEDSLEHNTPQLTVPKQKPDKAILNTLFGQKENISINFIMMQRSDDYTYGTGTAGDGSPATQWAFFKSSVFQPTGYHVYYDENGTAFVGRIVSARRVKQSDEPIIYHVSVVFAVGLSPL